MDLHLAQQFERQQGLISPEERHSSKGNHFKGFYASIIATARVHPALPPFILAGKQATLKPNGGN